ncbi:MAG: formylglycine-generating enzyme family protein [Bacteroidales bacterium]|nr:formylglycine-generating enzyme family protein [Bacteroidales bacterium]
MKARITFIITLVCLLTGISVKAQNNLSNINVQQQDTVLYISYDLQQKSDIYLYVSLNDGKSFLGPMKYVSGDVGYNVHSGNNKVIFWYAVSEMGYIRNSNVRFKIVARTNKDSYIEKTNLQYVKVEGDIPFEIGTTEVTIYQYAQFVENTGYKTTAEVSGYSHVWNGSSWEKKTGVNWNTDNNGNAVNLADSQVRPVTHLSYVDVVMFCSWAGCRLPSVEEWTTAAKAGRSFKYAGSDKAGDVAWNRNNSGGRTHNVASKQANAFGIYDMCGNVAEWTSDRNDSEYIFCGGSYYSDPDDCTVYTRSQSTALGSNSLVGFRVVKASSKDAALPTIVVSEERNYEPSFSGSRSDIEEIFVTLNLATSRAPQTSIGATYGRYEKFGWFVSLMTGFNFRGLLSDGKCDENGYVGNSYPLYSGDKSRNRLSLMGGGILKINNVLCAKVGLGFGLRNLNYETVSGGWIRSKKYSTKGIDMSAGVQFDINGIILSGDFVTTNFKTFEFKLGVGLFY